MISYLLIILFEIDQISSNQFTKMKNLTATTTNRITLYFHGIIIKIEHLFVRLSSHLFKMKHLNP